MNLPTAFIDYTRSLLGNEKFEKLAHALEQEQPISIRLNKKLEESDTASFTDQVKWCESGRYLDRRPTFTFDPLFHAGCYYVQEASSMFLEQVIRQHITEPVKMLDLCAAPGGKSTHARSILPKGSLLISNELIRTRSQVLAENMTKWGDAEVVITSNAPADFAKLQGMFDVLLTDMPCSGEGMFRKDEGAVKEWSRENVEICRQRQRSILEDSWSCLRLGGLLIYSTCTFNTLENEENVQWIINELGAQPLKVKVEKEWGITGNLLKGADFPVYRFFPGNTRGEGFFLAALRKNGENAKLKKKNKENKKRQMPIQGIRDLMVCANSWITDNERYRLSTDGKTITAFAKEHVEYLDQLSKILHIIQAGVTIGEIRGKNLIPQQSLAMSKLFKKEAIPQQEIDYDSAIAYLRKESIMLDPQTPHGCILLTYHHIPLGFVKNMGNRTNNFYPQEWRIRSGHRPEEIRTLLKL